MTARPDPVTVALVLTIVVASVVFVMTLASLVLLASQSDVVLEEHASAEPATHRRARGTDSQLVAASYVSDGLILVWSAARHRAGGPDGAGRRPGPPAR